MARVEFTIEPFREGEPGPHVTEAAGALGRWCNDVEVGPFGTSATVGDDDAPEAVAAVVRAALGNGATHISLSIASTDG